MERLPNIRKLTAEVMNAKAGRQSISASVNFLLSNRADLEYFSDLEDFLFASGPPRKPAFEYHLGTVRRSLATALWSRGLFIGSGVLDALLFQATAHTLSSNPLRWVLEYIRDHQLHGSGLVIYPLHSFGVLGAGLFRWLTGLRPVFISPSWGIALSPQSNGWERTYSFLERVRRVFEIKRGINRELLEHWSRSRPLRWFTQNPLLVIRARSFPHDYYDNQALLITRLQFATTLCFMLASLQPRLTQRQERMRLFSSATTNNFQTLDIRHYLVLYPDIQHRGALSGQCVPIHGRPSALAELSDLAVELSPAYWHRHRQVADNVQKALTVIEAGFLRSRTGAAGSLEARFHRKVFDALSFFRRSFRRADSPAESTVNLAIAFETLLTDYYAPSISERLAVRLLTLLGKGRGTSQLVRAVTGLYEARGQVVHQGRHDISPDIFLCQKAFGLALTNLSARLPKLRAASPDHPIQDLLGV